MWVGLVVALAVLSFDEWTRVRDQAESRRLDGDGMIGINNNNSNNCSNNLSKTATAAIT